MITIPLLLSVLYTANAVPLQITHQSRLLDANGAAILIAVPDSDTLAGLGCNDGEVAKYDTDNGA